MTALINQITINGELTTFLNYVNPVVKGVSNNGLSSINSLLTTHFGDDRTKWTSGGDQIWAIRFPTTWETKTGNIAVPSYPGFSGQSGAGNSRVTVTPGINGLYPLVSSSNANTNTTVTMSAQWGNYTNAPSSNQMIFAVIDNYGIFVKSFYSNSIGIDSNNWVCHCWLKDGKYTGSQYPRNFVSVGHNSFQRVTQEGLTTATGLLSQNPALSCNIATIGANSSEIIIRDSLPPNHYIGILRHSILLPSSAVLGKIYKNTGIDPDTGVVETDQKAFWMCIGNWGTEKIGMRVWTENIL